MKLICRLTYIYLFFCTTASAAVTPVEPHQFVGTNKWLQTNKVTLNKSSAELNAIHHKQGNVLLSGKPSSGTPSLVTRNQFEDSIVTFDFMLTENTKAGIFLQSRYEIKITDNHQQHELNHSDMGGLDSRENSSDEENSSGLAPSTNATRAPGVWQTIEIHFRSPRFNDTGDKTDNALFITVKVNNETVQANTIATGFTRGSSYPWEQSLGEITLQLHQGQIAIRNFNARRADFGHIIVPDASGQKSNAAELINYVEQGKQHFLNFGCIECHATKKNDTSTKSGPNLFGLFSLSPRDREIIESGENHRFTIKANHNYLQQSIRAPQSQLAVFETGDSTKVYPAIMPAYNTKILTDKHINALGDYLKTLNNIDTQGPIVKLIKNKGVEKYDPLEDRFLFLVDGKTRIQRGPMPGLSGRSIHVGTPHGLNYSFDPRILGIAKIWQGGFLNMSGELQNRGGGGLRMGHNSQEISLSSTHKNNNFLMVPLNKERELIDFSFKEAKFSDKETMIASLNSEHDHLPRLKEVNAQFLGYTEASGIPSFQYRIGSNIISASTDIKRSGETQITISGTLELPQVFSVNTNALSNVNVSHGSIENGQWTVPANTQLATLTAKIPLSKKPWAAKPSNFNYYQQKLEIKKAAAELPNGYSIESFMPPKDNYNRDQLFEALGLAVAKDGTIVVATRTAGIWRIVNNEWHLFAEGTFDSLGLVIEDDKGLVLTVGQKAELTRISDTNHDGIADSYKTLFDAFSYHGNYHTYMHGPVKMEDGRYFVALNLAHNDFSYKAGGQYMGTMGGFSGWGFMVDEQGKYEPWVHGLRSPAGLGIAPNGKLWYLENQGEYVGTSKLFEIKKDAFYGHPSSLVDLPGMLPTSKEISWENVKTSREQAAVLFPHNRLANSPGHIAWDLTLGKFGPFKNQSFIGDQTQSNLFRLDLQKHNNNQQGAVIPFATGLASGVMRPVFLKDGSMLIGQTGRGWQARGGNIAALQRIIWDGHTVPNEIDTVIATQHGFDILFTHPIHTSSIDQEHISISSWLYRDAPDYGSPELDEKDEKFRSLALSKNRKILSVHLESTTQNKVHTEQTPRVYHIKLNRSMLFSDTSKRSLDAFYTVHKFN